MHSALPILPGAPRCLRYQGYFSVQWPRPRSFGVPTYQIDPVLLHEDVTTSHQ